MNQTQLRHAVISTARKQSALLGISWGEILV